MKARSVVFAPEAKDDLIDLFDYIASVASPDIALSFLDRIEGFCNNMDVGSERGLRRDDIRPGLRLVGFERRLTVAFTVSSDHVTILRIFYGGQNWETKL